MDVCVCLTLLITWLGEKGEDKRMDKKERQREIMDKVACE